MKHRILSISKIADLEDGQNGEKRYSLRDGKTEFCVAVIPEGESLDAKVGDTVVAVERSVTTNEGETVTQWYFDRVIKDPIVWANQQALKDGDVLVEMAKAKLLGTKVEKEYKPSEHSVA
jgi:hypothetical protein